MIRATTLLACLLLAACGQRGALYFPEEARATTVPVTPAATPAATGDAAETEEQQRQRQQQQQQAAPATPGN